jgi:hypothetical protein
MPYDPSAPPRQPVTRQPRTGQPRTGRPRTRPPRPTRPRPAAAPLLWALAAVGVLVGLFLFGAAAQDFGREKEAAVATTDRPAGTEKTDAKVTKSPGLGDAVRDTAGSASPSGRARPSSSSYSARICGQSVSSAPAPRRAPRRSRPAAGTGRPAPRQRAVISATPSAIAAGPSASGPARPAGPARRRVGAGRPAGVGEQHQREQPGDLAVVRAAAGAAAGSAGSPRRSGRPVQVRPGAAV